MTNLKVGDEAPDFTGLDQNGNSISLKDYAGKKLMLFWFIYMAVDLLLFVLIYINFTLECY